MPSLEVEIINKVTNLGAFAEEKAALSSAVGGTAAKSNLQTQNAIQYGSQLTAKEEAYAGAQLASMQATNKSSGAFKEYETRLKNATVLSGEAGSVTDGLARKMSALGSLGITPMAGAMVGAVVGLAALVIAGKSWIENADKQEAAVKGIDQAVAAYNHTLGKTTAAHSVYVTTSIKAGASAATLATENDRVRIATNSVASAQISYNDALAKYGASSSQAQRAAISLEDAQIRLQEATRGVGSALSTTTGHWVTIAGTHRKAAIDLDAYLKMVDSFITKNARYVSSMYDAEGGFAKLTRSGLTQSEVLKDMNRATDLAALKNISLTDAVNLIDNAEHGHMRGLIDLGITTAKYTDANGNLIPKLQSVKQAMAELDPKLKGGRQTLSESTQASNNLHDAWDKLSNQDGPGLSAAIVDVKNKAADMINNWMDFANNPDVWSHLQTGLIYWIGGLKDALGWIGQIGNALNALPSQIPQRRPGGRSTIARQITPGAGANSTVHLTSN